MSESKAQQVEIRDVDGQTLKKLVDYIYTAMIEVTEDNVQVSYSVPICDMSKCLQQWSQWILSCCFGIPSLVSSELYFLCGIKLSPPTSPFPFSSITSLLLPSLLLRQRFLQAGLFLLLLAQEMCMEGEEILSMFATCLLCVCVCLF